MKTPHGVSPLSPASRLSPRRAVRPAPLRDVRGEFHLVFASPVCVAPDVITFAASSARRRRPLLPFQRSSFAFPALEPPDQTLGLPRNPRECGKRPSASVALALFSPLGRGCLYPLIRSSLLRQTISPTTRAFSSASPLFSRPRARRPRAAPSLRRASPRSRAFASAPGAPRPPLPLTAQISDRKRASPACYLGHVLGISVAEGTPDCAGHNRWCRSRARS
mmetsp:Transcript_9086/g.34284  ORF Transcript_9086/g.34284 Transcript_9086/m.34284 type:complete len:221 (-) Transcript_9086:120-782(-)